MFNPFIPKLASCLNFFAQNAFILPRKIQGKQILREKKTLHSIVCGGLKVEHKAKAG